VTNKQFDLFGCEIVTPVRKPVNVASVPQRSPFRYPGGKTWFVPRLRQWLSYQLKKPRLLIEPFAGGGIVSLTAGFEDLAESIIMVELDEEIAAVWKTILSKDVEWLVARILDFEMSLESAIIEINKDARTPRELAFRTIIKNRTQHGGILAAGSGLLKNGEAGKGVLSRWYPDTLAKRIRAIATIADKIKFLQGDAFAAIRKHKNNSKAVFFIDPPYTAGGKNAGSRLYTHSKIDHDILFLECSKLSGDFIMTYDHSDEVRKLAIKHGFQAKPIPMKNTHHAEMTELVIGRCLDWMEDTPRLLESEPKYGKSKKK
jgi:DNA adenine methylase